MVRIESHTGWNEEVLRMGGDFLQSWEWGRFQASGGADVLCLRGESSLALLLRRSLPFGRTFWYCPRGPLGGTAAEIAELPEIAAADFLRFEPRRREQIPSGARKTRDVQPGQTLIVDLKRDPEALMADMHEKWRYNIRLAERKGVRVYMAGAKDPSAAAVFWDLLEETTERDRFRGHDRIYYQRMLEMLAGDPASPSAMQGEPRPVARLVFAEHDGRVLAANLMIYFGKMATYLHGASSRLRREVMAPHLLHWKAMQDAKAWGYEKYDFWGVAPEKAENHPWAGISRFKRGFGGTYVEYPGTYDLPINRFWYTLYALAKRLRP